VSVAARAIRSSSWKGIERRSPPSRAVCSLLAHLPASLTANAVLDPNQLDPPAGFAARRYDASICFPDLTTYDALVLDIPQSDGKKYTFFIKDTPPEKRPDGRLSASVSWEHDFHCPG